MRKFFIMYIMRTIIIISFVLLFSAADIHASGAYSLNDSSVIVGARRIHTIQNNDSLIKLARKYDVGYNEITAANTDVDPWVPEKGTRIVIPTAWLLPEVMDEGVLINLAELRLYYFFSIKENRYVKTFPIGIGRQGFDTPTGDFRITLKLKDPVWHVPEEIRKDDPEMPAFVPPGPDNPLGSYWLHLSINGYGIHGTSRPYGIGRRVSHGCIRLYPEDIEVLSTYISTGTRVRIINEPVKAGMHNDKVYIEVHNSDEIKDELFSLVTEKLSRKHLLKHVSTQRIIHAVKNPTGLPAVVSE